MANNENAFQIALVKEAQNLGGNAMRVRHHSMGGIPDLYIKLNNGQSCWVECKFERGKPKKSQKPTQLQLSWLRKERRAKGHAGWALCVKVKSGHWEIYVGVDEEFKPTENWLCIRKTGEPWPVEQIVFAITEQSINRRVNDRKK
tara:strand:+ start:6207 stop:6641 length:435 start_codon:yes stop_codon:yes gene_type:complete